MYMHRHICTCTGISRGRLSKTTTLRLYRRCKFSAWNWQVLASYTWPRIPWPPSPRCLPRTMQLFKISLSPRGNDFSHPAYLGVRQNSLFTASRRMSYSVRKRFSGSINRIKQYAANSGIIFRVGRENSREDSNKWWWKIKYIAAKTYLHVGNLSCRFLFSSTLSLCIN